MRHPDYNDITPEQAVNLQRQMQEHINLSPLTGPVQTVAGADISFNKFSEIVYAGIVVLRYPEMQVIHRASAITKTRFPYVPGLLAFREVPALLEVWEQLEVKPDVLILDGHGIAHPRRLGIATHFGLLVDHPTIGCAKSLLAGKYEEPDAKPGATSVLMHRGEAIGTALRTKLRCKPVFVSPGHKTSMDDALTIIRHCVGKYRIPEPTRLAHLLVNEVRLANPEKP